MFDLDKAIKKWQRTLRQNEALEDGYVEELTSHLREEMEHLLARGWSEKESFTKAVEVIGQIQPISEEYYKVNTCKLSGRPPWKLPFFVPDLLWN